MSEKLGLGDLEALEAETLRQLEAIRELREKQLLKINDSVSSDDECGHQEFQDPRYTTKGLYSSNYALKDAPITGVKQKSALATSGRFKGDIPVANREDRRRESKREQQVRDRIVERRELTRSKTDTKNAVGSLVAQMQARKRVIEGRRQQDAIDRSNFIENQKLAFDLPVGFKEVRVQMNTTLDEASDPALTVKPPGYDRHTDPAYDEYTHKLLSYRFIEKAMLRKIMEGTQTLTPSKFVAHCCPPQYEKPPYANWCVVGVVSQKSDIMVSSNNKKYRRIIVTDFNVDVMVFVWDKALKRYQDIPLGSVVAILNPHINSYTTTNGKYNATGSSTAFNLKIENDINNMLIYARFRYFGTCADVNHAGQNCTTAIDKSKGRFCTYHFEQRYKKSTSGRMDLTGSYHSFGVKDKRGNETVLYESKDRLGQMGTKSIESKPTSHSTILPNYDAPTTKKNMLEPHQRSEKLFTSNGASLAFHNEKAKNLTAIKRQEEQRKLDRKLMRERAKRDYEISIKMKEASEAELHKRANAAKKRNIIDTLSTIATAASKNLDKTREAKKKRAVDWSKNMSHLEKLKTRRITTGKDGLKMEFAGDYSKDSSNSSDDTDADEGQSFAAFKRKFGKNL